jgi:hypothetical protein
MAKVQLIHGKYLQRTGKEKPSFIIHNPGDAFEASDIEIAKLSNKVKVLTEADIKPVMGVVPAPTAKELEKSQTPVPTPVEAPAKTETPVASVQKESAEAPVTVAKVEVPKTQPSRPPVVRSAPQVRVSRRSK